MRVYLSGPMSGIADNNFPAFHEHAAQLRAQGFYVAFGPGARTSGVCDADAKRDGLVLTIEQVPLQPLAMGHYETVVSVRPKR